MIELTKDEKKVYEYLKEHNGKFISPTQIGKEVGGISSTGIPRHSAWASQICSELVTKELIIRHQCGWYASKSAT